MDALTPPSDPAPAPVSPVTAPGPTCAACTAPAVVHWLRRPTDDEASEVIQAEQRRRDVLRQLSDPQLPPPEFGPLPSADDMTRAVYACAGHAITADAASRVHASSCTAPNDADLPGCDCTPERLPQDPVAEEPGPALPDSWVTGGA